MKEFRFKCWVEEDGEKIFGPGPVELLRLIEKEGSLSKAADKMKMSYKKAWDMVKRLNEHSEDPLVILKKGGSHGGGAQVTAHGIRVMAEFQSIQDELKKVLESQQDFLQKLK
ncbi:LysR family transcriptional regulator [Gramella sp. BOM4]|nr:LysR family transcriptional regulator [Christiangramia bathymodioli]